MHANRRLCGLARQRPVGHRPPFWQNRRLFVCSRSIAVGARSEVLIGAPVAPRRPVRLVTHAQRLPKPLGPLPNGPAAYPPATPHGGISSKAHDAWRHLVENQAFANLQDHDVGSPEAMEAELADISAIGAPGCTVRQEAFAAARCQAASSLFWSSECPSSFAPGKRVAQPGWVSRSAPRSRTAAQPHRAS